MSASLTTSGGCLARRVTSSYCVASRTRKISSLAAKSNPHRVRPCISAQYPHKCRNIPAAVSGQVYMTLHVSRCNSTLAARKTDKHRVFVAFGSNIGDRINMIEQACRLLQKHDDIKILRTSSLWETKAMYVVDQADFLNGACEIETTLDPIELLNELQRIERELNRVKLVDKGPRTIDLDILLYDDEIINHDRLQVPHKLMLERAFVLKPLAELIPHHTIPTDPTRTPIQQHLLRLPPQDRPSTTIVPLSPTSAPLTPLLPTRKSHIMSIINLTPDSFSDGGVNPVTTESDISSFPSSSSSSTKTALTDLITSHLEAGATILDIGGQSTRPHAPIITAAEELQRILPSIKHISTSILPSSPNPHAAISIDTFRSSVASAAIAAGAHIVNDVTAGHYDPEMLPTVAKLGCSIILMHMRGSDPSTMNNKANTSYPGGLIPTIARELLSRIHAAEAAGIPRWRILLDPGIGFSKTLSQNLEIIRSFSTLRATPELRGFGWVVGASRKGFIGTITGVKVARERSWGTAAVVAAGVQAGVDVCRVHDVAEMGRVVRMGEAIWRV